MSRRRLQFGSFLLDAKERRLWRGGQVLTVPPKVFDLLVYLVGRRGSLVSKQELMEAVWAGVFVEEATLARAVSELRKILKDGEEGAKFIETVPKFGYRFVHEVEAEAPGGGPGRRRWMVAALACALCGVGALGLMLWRADSTKVQSIAVLPIRVEVDGEEVNKGVAIADALITSLSRATTLEVRSINAVRGYATKPADAVKAGRELGVDAVFEGALHESGDRVRLNARLVRVSDGQSLWSGVIQEEAADTFALQDRLAAEVASSIDSRLTAGQRQALADHGTRDAKAHQMVMRGRQYVALRSWEGFRRAIQCYEETLRRDPEYAEAHAHLAEALFLYSGYRSMPQGQVIERVRQEARRAIELNPRLADPHRVLALVAENYDYDRSGSEREYKIALSLNPRDGATHHFYAELLGMIGRFDEAAGEFEIASRLEPTSLIVLIDWAKIESFERKFDSALKKLQTVVERDSGFQHAYAHFGMVYFAAGEYQRSMEWNLKGTEVMGLGLDKHWAGLCLAAMGRKREAAKLYKEWDAEQAPGFPHYFARAKHFAWMGEPEKAVEQLELQYRTHETPGLIGIEADPGLDPLRTHPRFQALLRRMGAVEPEVVRRSARQIMARFRRPASD